MRAAEEHAGDGRALQGAKGKLSLFIEVTWALLLILPCVLHALFRMIFPRAGKSLKGQVVLVTGAGRGLGRGLAQAFAREGCQVAVVDINRDSADKTAAEIVNSGGVAKAYVTDVSRREQVVELGVAVTRDLGPVDILVNNAAIIYSEAIDGYTDQEIEDYLAVNLTSHFWMVRQFLPSMKERNFGHIVAISSVVALVTGPNGTPYSATKAGLRGFMDSLRAELLLRENNNINTTTVFPYFIRTGAAYEKTMDLRLPPLTLEEAVQATIYGIKQEKIYLSIPSALYRICILSWLLPQYVYERLRVVFYCRVPKREKREFEAS